jgi:hypothetical protein
VSTGVVAPEMSFVTPATTFCHYRLAGGTLLKPTVNDLVAHDIGGAGGQVSWVASDDSGRAAQRCVPCTMISGSLIAIVELRCAGRVENSNFRLATRWPRHAVVHGKRYPICHGAAGAYRVVRTVVMGM